MIKVLVDTNIIIDYLRSGKDLYLKLVQLQENNKIELFISSITVLELFAGKSSQKSTAKLLELIDLFRIIPVNEELARLAGELKRDNNLSMAIADLLIATSAFSIHAKLATRNRRHYRGIPNLRFYPLSAI